MSEAEFSVYQFAEDGRYVRELSFVTDRTAVVMAMSLARSAAGRVGLIRRIIITDGGDFTVFEWKFGEGVTYPVDTTKAHPARH